MDRILVVAPHTDDECFGCLGALLKHKEEGALFGFLWFTGGRGAKQAAGMDSVVDYFKARYGRLLGLTDQELDTYPLKKLIGYVEDAIEKFKPTIAYIPFIGDLNKDHRLVSEACMVAMRPYKKESPSVLMYAIPGTTEIGLREFKPTIRTMFLGINKHRLIDDWYPGERINGRDAMQNYESFEAWPNGYEYK